MVRALVASAGGKVDTSKKNRTTSEAIYDHALALAKEYGLWETDRWRLRVVLVEATPEQKIIESRDFDLVDDEA